MMASTKPRSSMISASTMYMMPMRLWSTLVSHSVHRYFQRLEPGDDDGDHERAAHRDQGAARGDGAVERQGFDRQFAEHALYLRAGAAGGGPAPVAWWAWVYLAMIESKSLGSTAE